ncbi:MAG: DJ-1/PfpI family protein [Campylobacterales bacterium]|nr:DJ-1/PfpI family protein [Campylobacterales bacterium]
MERTVLIPLANGFEEIEAVTLIDVLRRAQIRVISAGLDREVVVGAHGIALHVDMLLSDVVLDVCDMVVLPGGMPGAKHLAESDVVMNLLQVFDRDNKHIGAICAAPWALKNAGVLKDHYTCYPSFDTIINAPGYLSTCNVVRDHNIMTASGPAAAMEFALEIVKELCGEERYVSVKEALLFDAAL